MAGTIGDSRRRDMPYSAALEQYGTRVAEPLISIIVPCFNEEAVIQETHRRLTDTFADTDLEGRYEIVYVDDGSHDRTLLMLESIQATDKAVRVLSFSRNFGHQMAVSAGIDHAQGDAIVLIDADLQDPPELIRVMVEKWREGYDVVYGRRHSREGESYFKVATARLFYRFINRLSDVAIPYGHRRLPIDEPAGRERTQTHAGERSIYPRHGQLGRLSSMRLAL